MRGLTLWQPWASLVAIGVKTYETRSWKVTYRGPLAIHAAQREPVRVGGEVETSMVWELDAEGFEFIHLPRGAIVAVCELVDCFPVEELWPELSEMENEQYFGDWSAGRYAWTLSNVRLVNPPLWISGSRGLWQVQSKVVSELVKLIYP